MNLIERFIRYIQIDTQADDKATSIPSNKNELELAKLLSSELAALGVPYKLSKEGVLYAHLKANIAEDLPTVGFIAHLDTATEKSGAAIKPQLLRNYQGGTIILNQEKGIKLDPQEFPLLKKDRGADLIFTDGTTLLGGDDKAGVAEIMTLIAYLQTHPDIKHRAIAIAFTPDEEIGHGVDHFDLDYFKAAYAFTIDGGSADEIEYENFNAASAQLTFKGKAIHPGSAKGKMLNSQLIAMEFHNLLPVFANPAYTEGYEGFNHLTAMEGNVELTRLSYIIRNHDYALFQKQIQDFENGIAFINRKYGPCAELKVTETYRNMAEILKDHQEIIEEVKKKMAKIGLKAKTSPIRGGTDGARLSYLGLPCPNLGTGDRYCHSAYEYVNLNEMRKVVELLLEIVKYEGEEDA